MNVTILAPEDIQAPLCSLLEGLTIPGEDLQGITVRVDDDHRSAAGDAGNHLRWSVTLPPAGALPVLVGQVVASATARLRRHLFLHAGAVAFGGRAWILVGASGSGKTSTVAALLARGAGYLTDEVTIIDPAALAVVPFPLSMTIKPWTAQAIVALPPGHEVAREGQVYFYRPDRVVAEHIPIERIVLLEPHPGSPALSRLSPGDLLMRLAGHPSSLNRPERLPQAFRGFARVVRHAQCLRLRAPTPVMGAELLTQHLN